MTLLLDPHDIRHSPMLKAFKAGEYCDLTVTCGDLSFKVHKAVLCTASEFFRNACRFKFGKEAFDGRIDLPEDDPQMVRRMIIFLYHLDYDPTENAYCTRLRAINHHEGPIEPAPYYHDRYIIWKFGSDQKFASYTSCACLSLTKADSNSPKQPRAPRHPNMPEKFDPTTRTQDTYQIATPLTIHASMYALADKYQIEFLADLAKDKFKSCLDDHWDTLDFVDAVAIAYGSTPEDNRGLRDVVVEAFQKYFQVGMSQLPGIEEKLADFDELAFLLLKSWPKRG